MSKKNTTKFLNVDLDVYSKSDLAPLVHALEGRVSVLYLGREKDVFSVHLEPSSVPKSAADAAICSLARIVSTLPRPARNLWNVARSRTFNIGIQSGEVPGRLEMVLSPTTLRQAAILNADIAVTVYGLLKGRGFVNRKRKVPSKPIC